MWIDQGKTLGQGLGEVGKVPLGVLHTCLHGRLRGGGPGHGIWGGLGSF